MTAKDIASIIFQKAKAQGICHYSGCYDDRFDELDFQYGCGLDGSFDLIGIGLAILDALENED